MRVNHVHIAVPKHRVPVVVGGYYEQHGSPMFLARFEDNAGSNDYVFINAVTGEPLTRFMSRGGIDVAVNDGSFVYYEKAEISVPGHDK